ncbi:berberine bridge enzyme-like 19 [Silene latifolia]|uniref:berberine bridge enzyme-like 19 n=1 Tax=Silene latifolia TaxID=37657 RepID=UPI003D775C9F
MVTKLHNYGFLLFFIIILSSSSLSFSATLYDNFLQCLTTKTNSPKNISSILYTQNNTQFTSVLDAYIRNLRFTSPTTRKPQLIFTPLNPTQVSAVVICSNSLGLHVKIRSGGHDYDGLSYISDDPFVILDMINLRNIKVDPVAGTAYIEAGATLGELYYRISEKSNVYGFPAGVCPTVGVGGHVSGGGYGNMIRKYGLSVDHIIDAQVVDYQGRILNRKSMGEDLFWAIRGGGGASFAVVLSFTVNLVPVPETVTVFNVLRYQSDNATDLVYKWQTVMKDIDHNLFIRLLLQPVTDPKQKGKKTARVTFIALYLGNSDSLVSVLNVAFPELGIRKQDCQEMSWVQSALFWANFDNDTSPDVLLNRTYNANYGKRKSDYVQTPIPKQGLELLWQKLVQIGKPGLVFNSYGGIMNEIAADAVPFPHRNGNLFKIQYSIGWKDAGQTADDTNIGLIRQLYAFMEPYVSQNPRGTYLNYRDVDIGINRNWTYKEGEVYGRKYFLGNFDRLVKVKGEVDPRNFFRNEQSIPLLNS